MKLKTDEARPQWLPVILAAQEAAIKRIMV
jgi:hypothetical protein